MTPNAAARRLRRSGLIDYCPEKPQTRRGRIRSRNSQRGRADDGKCTFPPSITSHHRDRWIRSQWLSDVHRHPLDASRTCALLMYAQIHSQPHKGTPHQITQDCPRQHHQVVSSSRMRTSSGRAATLGCAPSTWRAGTGVVGRGIAPTSTSCRKTPQSKNSGGSCRYQTRVGSQRQGACQWPDF